MLSTSITEPNDSSPTNQRARWTIASAMAQSSTSAQIVALVAIVATVFATTNTSVPIVTGLVIVSLVPVALVDVLVKRLPNRMVATAALIGVAAASASVLLGGRIDLAAAGLGALALAGPLLLAHLISPASMGFGDVKFAVVLGAAVGLVAPLLALFALTAGALLAAIHGLASRQTSIAFGPGLLAGAILSIVAVALGAIDLTDASAVVALAGRNP